MEFNESIQKIKIHFQEELKSIRTGRANIGIVSDILVEAYGSKIPISQTSSIGVSDARTLVIDPWDKSLVKNIEKAILSCGKNISPVVDGNIIRIIVPEMTQETRIATVKQMREKLENTRVSVRKCREEEKKRIENEKKAGSISEDQMHIGIKKLDENTRETTSNLEKEADLKEKEIMTI